MYKESGIYCYRNKINGKLYIGQAKNLHVRYLNFLNTKQRYAGQIIENARNKYGVDNFEYSVLTHCPIDELNYWEAFYVERLNCVTPHGYNMTNGGDSVYTSTQAFKNAQTEKLKQTILSKNPNLDVSKVKYEGNRIPVIITCPIHGTFKKMPDYFRNPEINDLCCPKCVREDIRQKSEDRFFKQAKKKWGDKYDYSKTVIVDRITPVTITCPIHGDFTVLPGNHVCKDKNTGGCQQCSEERQHIESLEKGSVKVIKMIKKKFGNKYSLDKFEYKGDKEKVTLICPIHGEFSMTPGNLRYSNGCPQCTLENAYRIKYSGGTNEQVFEEQSRKVHGDKYDYSKVVYKHQHKKVCIICPEHGEFYQKPNAHLSGFGCPKCGQKYRGTRKTILQYSLDDNFIQEWESYDAITNKLGFKMESICSCCTGKKNTAYGFKWKHKEDNTTNPTILQLTKDNVLVREWKNMPEIHKAKPINSTQHITKCLQGYMKTAGGFIWKYKEE
jgi:group I intron endonuclease